MRKGSLVSVGSGDWVLTINGGPGTSEIVVGRYPTRGTLYRACRAMTAPGIFIKITRDLHYEFVDGKESAIETAEETNAPKELQDSK